MGQATKWTSADMPDLSGKTAVVTGANSGLGFETARRLAGAGATVVLACRDQARGGAALARLLELEPRAQGRVMDLDLADLSSAARFAEAVASEHAKIDILCNNAGVMALPYCETADGFEMQFGTNHLGHFALTGRLLPLLLAAPAARVVTMSSNAHRFAGADPDLAGGDSKYRRWRTYGTSKLANLLFAYELERRFSQAGTSARSIASHPGYSSTELQSKGAIMSGSRFKTGLWRLANSLLAQRPEKGALPALYAASAEGAGGGRFYGPDGFGESYGYPTEVRSNPRSYDEDLAARLWARSEELTGLKYEEVLSGP
jgi:NAD(P)-dependent dehydrogenase (short-subunit alcohol dehydrogenase family)